VTSSVPRYGRFDQFHGSASTDAAQLRDLATRLELRGRAPDEVAARAADLDLLGIQPGEQVLDVGCGTGVVTRDVARRVGRHGRVVGVDPSPFFLTIARELLERDGLTGVVELRTGEAGKLPVPDGEFDVALAVTVLSHLAGGEAVVPELVRAVRRGGRVGVFDLDTDSQIVAHPDRALTRRMVAAHSDNGVIDGWLARRLPGLLAAAGLVDVNVRAFTPLERDPRGFYAGVAERAAEIAVQVGAVTEAERQQWLADLRAEQDAGRFLAGRTHLFVWGRKETS
jgi:ubiquinone/menaquinone biosynthesis C-methylase UbiE